MDENVPLHSVRALRAAGHDVYSASETAPGALDETLLAVAHAEQRLIVTFDRDFGELAVRLHRGASGGIMLLRLVPHDPVEVTQFLSDLLARTDVEWAGRLSVIDRWHVRQRRLESRVPPIELGAAANQTLSAFRGNRHYDSPRGLITQEDPIGLAGGMNLYGFGGGDPINFGDPFGLCPQNLRSDPDKCSAWNQEQVEKAEEIVDAERARKRQQGCARPK